ncbi:BON domain-containing protein [Zoogloea sp.]|uniref:BON domain-containing protein n=1 Tax=Zoogloea sp. TaxID=49181 RepID=UPI001415C1E0|nr:MAG: BON domain-containing protein [Zoogloea sp.]
MKPHFTRILVASVLALSAVGPTHAAADATEKSAISQYVDDASITANIKAKHAEDKIVHTTAVSVETHDGVVQLSGFVPSPDEKARAEALAKTVKGVKSVVNNIIVRQ